MLITATMRVQPGVFKLVFVVPTCQGLTCLDSVLVLRDIEVVEERIFFLDLLHRRVHRTSWELRIGLGLMFVFIRVRL